MLRAALRRRSRGRRLVEGCLRALAADTGAKAGGPARRGAGAVPEAVGGGDAVFRRHPEIVERALGDELFLVDRSSEAIYHLNAISAALWRLLAEPTTVQGAAGVLHRAFPDIAQGRIERDVRALLADLAARKLVSAAS